MRRFVRTYTTRRKDVRKRAVGLIKEYMKIKSLVLDGIKEYMKIYSLVLDGIKEYMKI